MGFAMARLLAQASPGKVEPLRAHGASIAAGMADLAACDVVFTMLSTGDVVKDALLGGQGLLAPKAKPRIVVDCSSISVDASNEIRDALSKAGIAFIAAPVSGNPHVVEAGQASFVVSGPRSAFDEIKPLLLGMAKSATYVGEGELARVAKICHNVWLGSLTQSLAEVVVLAQKAGLTRGAFLEFINVSALGSTYTRVKTPHWVALDFAATFTPVLMRKDMDLGIDLAHELGASLPLASITRDLLQALINRGFTDQDFSTLLLQQAEASGLKMESENTSGSGT
jgi:3-hydroxyisobutyrate dehydrogenase-like beta-hydroxyacid dehydrogenase